MIAEGVAPSYAATLVQYGWETIAEPLKQGGVTLMLERLGSAARIRAYDLAEKLKAEMRPLFVYHMAAILSGAFSEEMMRDWENDDADLLRWRAETAATLFERSSGRAKSTISTQEHPTIPSNASALCSGAIWRR
jgi:ketol-acid reductoisomerase